MFYDSINKAIEECSQEILNSSDDKIQESLSILQKTFSKVQFDLIIENVVRNNLSRMILDDPAPEVADHAIQLSLHEMEKVAHVMCQSVILDIQTDQNGSRKIEMPYYCTMGDLAYMILDVFNQKAGHYYRIQYPKDQIKWNPTETPGIHLPEILTQGNEQLTMDYEDTHFKIQSIQVMTHEHLFNFNRASILDGEDSKDPNFDLSKQNEVLLKNFHEIRNLYEK